MSQALCEGGRVEIRGFGAFSVKDYKSYIGRNPKTGQEVMISPRNTVSFIPSKILKNKMNK